MRVTRSVLIFRVLLAGLPVCGLLTFGGGGAFNAVAQENGAKQASESANPPAEVLTNQGVDEMGNNNLAGAVEKFKQALTIDPSCGAARRNLSSALNNQGTRVEPDEGVSYWRKALFVWPENRSARNNVSTFLRSTGKDPDSFEDRMALSDSFAKSGDFVSAVVEVREAIACKKDAVAEAKLKDYLKKAPALPK